MNKILLTLLLLFSTTIYAQTWEQMNNALVGRHHPISFSLDGKGYAITGTTPLGDPTDDVYEYDPVTDSWSGLPDFPGTARSFGIGTVAENGKAYIGFGATSNAYLNDMWSFEPATGTWTQMANCSCSGRRHPAMISIGDRIYVGLGDDASGDRADWWMYDILANTWTSIADLPGPARHHPFMFNAGGEVFAGLGHRGQTIYRDWYKLDTTTNTWSALALFPAEGRVAGTQFSIGDYGFVLSGDGDNHSFMDTGEMWRYDPSDDSWLEFTPHPGRSRWAPGSFVIDGDIYFFGGLNRFSGAFPTEVWKFADTTTVVMPPDTSTSINDISPEILANTFIYPNPVNGVMFWENDKSVTEVKIYNTLGQLVAVHASDVQKVNTDNFNNGMYIVQFYDKTKLIKTSKVMVQH